MTKYFFRGVLVLIPIAVTVYAVWWLVGTLRPLFGWVGGVVGGDTATLLKEILGVALSVVVITVLGMTASSYVGGRLVAAVERLFDRVPLVKLLHTSIKDLLGAFVGDKKSFETPVLVSLGGDGAAKVAGFVTREDLAFLGAEGHVAVYLPQSYNFAGNLLVVPRSRVQPVPASSSDVLAFLVSGGVSAVADAPAAGPALAAGAAVGSHRRRPRA
jgi:uncharacterized membrane protein